MAPSGVRGAATYILPKTPLCSTRAYAPNATPTRARRNTFCEGKSNFCTTHRARGVMVVRMPDGPRLCAPHTVHPAAAAKKKSYKINTPRRATAHALENRLSQKPGKKTHHHPLGNKTKQATRQKCVCIYHPLLALRLKYVSCSRLWALVPVKREAYTSLLTPSGA